VPCLSAAHGRVQVLFVEAFKLALHANKQTTPGVSWGYPGKRRGYHGVPRAHPRARLLRPHYLRGERLCTPNRCPSEYSEYPCENAEYPSEYSEYPSEYSEYPCENAEYPRKYSEYP
jgi:hypothetical protein